MSGYGCATHASAGQRTAIEYRRSHGLDIFLVRTLVGFKVPLKVARHIKNLFVHDSFLINIKFINALTNSRPNAVAAYRSQVVNESWFF
jgi:hypothetical protein